MNRGLGIAAIALAGALCFGLCACDDESGVGATVSEERWEAAFDEILREDAKHTITGSYTMAEPQNGQDSSLISEWTMTWMRGGGNQHLTQSGDIVKSTQGGADASAGKQHYVDGEMYFEKCDDGTEYAYMKMNFGEGFGPAEGEWEKTKITTDKRFGNIGIELLAKDRKGNYALFAYDAERKGYSLTEAADEELRGRLGTTVVRFNEAGELVSFGGEAEAEGGLTAFSAHCTFEFEVSYTAGEIVLPEVEENWT